MEITINDVSYQLHFGIKFIKAMDERHNRTQDGETFGIGVQWAAAHLMDHNGLALEDVIASALVTSPTKPSIDDIDKWIEDQEDIDKVCDDFLSELKTASPSVTRAKVLKALEAIETELQK